MTQKLYLVTVRGCRTPPGVDLHESYVVAESTDTAYAKVRDYLSTHSIGDPHERELEHIELLAQDRDDATTLHRLFT